MALTKVKDIVSEVTGIWIGPSWTGINSTTTYNKMSLPSYDIPQTATHRRFRIPYSMTIEGISLTVDGQSGDTYDYTINVYKNEVSQEELVFTHPDDFDSNATWDDKVGQKSLSSPIIIVAGDRISFEQKCSAVSGKELTIVPYGRV